MQTHHIETVVPVDGIITIRDLPFRSGEKVEIWISDSKSPAIAASCAQPTPIVTLLDSVRSQANRLEVGLYPLRGSPVTLISPTEPVSEADWEASK